MKKPPSVRFDAKMPRPLLGVLAVAAVSGAAVSPSPVLAASCAAVGLALFVWAMFSGSREVPPSLVRIGVLCGAGIVILSEYESVGPFPREWDRLRWFWLGLTLAALVAGFISKDRRRTRAAAVFLGVAAVVLTTVAATISEWDSPVGTDVYHAHREAGEAIAAGLNPYGATVQIPNGSPFAPEGSVIDGYPYPPVVAGTYATASIPADSRVISAVAWLGLIAWLGVRGLREQTDRDISLAVFLLLVATPVWVVIWFAAWTEPLSIALIVAALLAWRRYPISSAIVLGLALASKQYLVFLAPLVLLHKTDHKVMRATVTFATAGLTLAVGLAPDPGAFVEATLLNLADIGFRPDTQSLPGLANALGFELTMPIWLWLVVGLGSAIAISARFPIRHGFLGKAGLILGVVFLIGPAFPNYWFLVMALIGFATAFENAGQPSDAAPIGRVPVNQLS